MLLELKDICKSYPQGKEMVPVLRNINLNVEKGEYVAIMGPSGSGKTTLMNIIGCLDRPTSGSYHLDGQDLLHYKDREMSGVRLNSIGFVFQSFYLMPKETAMENVCLPLLYAGIGKRRRREIAREALERVGLGERIHYKPSQLSGGQCQRVAIARAISNKPKILLADEPTGALDSKSGAQIMELFQTLHEEGVTIIMITHDAKIAKHAQRTIRILDGQIVEEAAVDAGEARETAQEAARELYKPEKAAQKAARELNKPEKTAQEAARELSKPEKTAREAAKKASVPGEPAGKVLQDAAPAKSPVLQAKQDKAADSFRSMKGQEEHAKDTKQKGPESEIIRSWSAKRH